MKSESTNNMFGQVNIALIDFWYQHDPNYIWRSCDEIDWISIFHHLPKWENDKMNDTWNKKHLS